MVCVPFYNSNSEIPFITIIRNTSARCSNIPRVYSNFVECYCSPHSIFCFLCTFISNRAIRNRDSTITFGKGYWPVNHWPFCNYPLLIQWGTSDALKVGVGDLQVTQPFPVAVSTYLCGQATIFANKSSFNTNEWLGTLMAHILNATPNSITFLIDTVSRNTNVNISVGYVIWAKSI